MGIENNPDIGMHARRLLPEIQKKIALIQDHTSEQVRRAVLEPIFNDGVIRQNFKGAEIRYVTMCGLVAKHVLGILGEDPNIITLMAIGDVTLPSFIRPLVDNLRKKADAHEEYLTAEEEMGYGYDLSAKGYKKAREIAFKNWDKYYQFSESGDPDMMNSLAENSTIVPGGMHALTVMKKSLDDLAESKNLTKRYIYPDNSFGTWKAIAKESKNNPNSKTYEIPTNQADRLHLTAAKVHEFYAGNEIEGNDDTWYITPVGNPSGTAMSKEQLVETCEAILDHNPEASIILDCVYLRTMEVETANELISGVIKNPRIMNRALFIESLSKTHGITGLRVGMFFSANKELYDAVQNSDMTAYAGHGHRLSALMMAFLDDPNGEYENEFKKLHRFWAAERKGLHDYLIKSGDFSDLFDDNQDHIIQEQLDDPLGLYLFLKLKDGVTKMDIYAKTGCFGVENTIGSGKYMRFAVGKITEPTYSKFA